MGGETRKSGEKRLLILQMLAAMLEEPSPEKITTAALARRLDVSEAALYRHFASKAQMYEGLIAFIEDTLFGLIARITSDTPEPVNQVEAIISMLLSFAKKNRGMTRVLIGEALVNEDPRLQKRINQLHDRLEAQIRQCLRFLDTGHTGKDPKLVANLCMAFVVGRWHQFAKSGFTRDPLGDWPLMWRELGMILGARPAVSGVVPLA
jgi:TetR/AcrR family transcriptional regulator